MAVVVTQRDTTGVPAVYGSYVEWSAVFAGAVIAAGFSFVLLTFGAGIGLSLVSPYPHSYGRAAASIAAFWALVVPIAALLIGGYVAGRLRAPREGADATETDFRDGMHGVLVWAVSVLAGAALTFLAAGATAQGGFAGRAPADGGALYAPVVATLFSPVSLAEAALPAQPTPLPRVAAGGPAAVGMRGAEDTAAGLIATAVAAGQLTPVQRGYLAALVSQRTGLPPAEAEQRVNQAFAQARDAADKARLAAVVGALVAATALLLGLAGAWYGAQQGGRHRDTNIPARIVWGWKVRPGPVSPG